jgi:hypothetical protein
VIPPHAGEIVEEFEEAAHGRRRLVRLARQPAQPSADGAAARLAASQPRPAAPAPRIRVTAEPRRKAPAPVPDSASPTDDH